MKKILFALNQDQEQITQKKILAAYNKTYKENFEYATEYYLQGIYKALQEYSYDVLVLNEMLDKNVPISLSVLDNISDVYPNLSIIFIMENKHREDLLPKQLFSLGLYNGLFKDQLEISTLSKLINTPRGKKDAKSYYSIDLASSNDINVELNVVAISEEELNTVLEHFNNATNETIGYVFEQVQKSYNFEEIVYVVSSLSDDTRQMLEESCGKEYLRYKKVIDRELKQAIVKEKVVEKVKEIETIKKVKEIVEVEREKIVEKETRVEIYKTPVDYKKTAIFMGVPNTGTTTIILQVSKILALNNKKVAILDLTKNKDLFEMNIFNEENIFEPLKELNNGIIRPFPLEKNIDLFTCSINTTVELDNISIFNMVDLLKRTYDVVIIDSYLNFELYNVIDNGFIVTTQDLMECKGIAAKVKDALKGNITPVVITSKSSFIFNKFINSKKCTKLLDLKECSCTDVNYLDVNHNNLLIDYSEIAHFKVNCNVELITNNYKREYLGVIEEEVFNQLKAIANAIYPINLSDKSKFSMFNVFKKKGDKK